LVLQLYLEMIYNSWLDLNTWWIDILQQGHSWRRAGVFIVSYKRSTRQPMWVLWLQNKSKQINPANQHKSKGGKTKNHGSKRKQNLQEAYKTNRGGGLLSMNFWQKTSCLIHTQLLYVLSLYTIETLYKRSYFVKSSDPGNKSWQLWITYIDIWPTKPNTCQDTEVNVT
jgi:hypothetical protein